jgi:hypothetical protein
MNNNIALVNNINLCSNTALKDGKGHSLSLPLSVSPRLSVSVSAPISNNDLKSMKCRLKSYQKKLNLSGLRNIASAPG